MEGKKGGRKDSFFGLAINYGTKAADDDRMRGLLDEKEEEGGAACAKQLTLALLICDCRCIAGTLYLIHG